MQNGTIHHVESVNALHHHVAVVDAEDCHCREKQCLHLLVPGDDEALEVMGRLRLPLTLPVHVKVPVPDVGTDDCKVLWQIETREKIAPVNPLHGQEDLTPEALENSPLSLVGFGVPFLW